MSPTATSAEWEPDGPLGKMLEKIAEITAILGGFVLVAVMLIESASVIGRGLAGILPVRSIAGDSELVQIGGAIAIFAFLPYCQLRRGNVFVDFFTKGLPVRARSFLDLVANLLYFALAFAIALQLVHATKEKFEYGDTTTVLRLPESWPYLISTVLAWFLVIAILYSILRSAREIHRRKLIGPQPSGEH